MFRLFSRPRCAPRVSARLRIESLEERLVPANSGATGTVSPPVITSFGAATLQNHQIKLAGQVADSTGTMVTVSFSGAASGTVTCDTSGAFSYITSNASLGNVSASAVDGKGLAASPVSATISDTAPALSLTMAYGSQRTVVLSGRVIDVDMGGRTVTFSGVVNATVVTNSDGTFCLTTQASSLGTIQATTVDLWGLRSNTAQVNVTSNAPIIQGFTATENSNNYWTFSGWVSDESAPGLIVQFGGLPSVTGKTAVVGTDGTFSLTVQLQPGEAGDVTAQVTDWWGLMSVLVSAVVQPS